MRRDEIIHMALESGGRMYSSDEIDFFLPDLEKFVAIITAAEREACAKIVESNAQVCTNNSMMRDVLQSNAVAIRSRGNLRISGNDLV